MIIHPRNGLIGVRQDDARWDLFLSPAPTNLAATAGNAQVSLSWTAPTVLAQTPITDYVVQYSSDSGSTWTTFSDGTSTGTSATVTGLTNGTAYVFRVAAVNGVGTGAYSASSSAITPVAPEITITGQPSNQTASGGSATFSVTATVTQSATLSYQWQKQESGSGSFSNISGATSSSLALSNLTNADDNGDVYRVVVSATGGAQSVTSSSVTLTVPSTPGPITLTGYSDLNGTYSYTGTSNTRGVWQKGSIVISWTEYGYTGVQWYILDGPYMRWAKNGTDIGFYPPKTGWTDGNDSTLGITLSY